MSSILLADNGVSSGAAGLKSSADGTGTLALQTTTSGGAATTAVLIDNAQNVGVGVTPKAYTVGKAVEVGGAGNALWGVSSGNPYLTANTYFDGNYRYGTTGPASYYVQNSGAHIWATAASGTAGNVATFTSAMTLDASGKLGIGTTSPDSRLHVVDPANAGLRIGYNSTSVNYYDADTQIFRNGASTERARIDSSGNLLVGTTSQVGRLTMKQSAEDFPGGFISVASGGAVKWGMVVGGDGKFYLGYSASGTPAAVGNFATSGTYTATSDVRKKKDISYDFDGLALVMALKPAMGRMNEDADSHPLRPFLIAQDTQPVLPALVSSLEPDQSIENPILGVDYASMVPVLLKAIKEQQALITNLTERLVALEGK